MFGRLERFAPEILGVTRVLVGTLFAGLGARTVVSVLGGLTDGPPALVVWIGGGVELLGGVLLAASTRVPRG
jgi:hypothetical protein